MAAAWIAQTLRELAVTLSVRKISEAMSYYAVHAGRSQGVFMSWSECEKQVKGYNGAVFKKFSSMHDAVDFVNHGRGYDAGPSGTNKISSLDSGQSRKRKRPHPTVVDVPSSSCSTSANDPVLNDRMDVYTDGACCSNGKKNSTGGIGVFFGDDHPWNVSAPLFGKQTNICAEMEAACRAMEVAIKNGVSAIRIHTDSEFTINGATKWLQGWKKRDWKLSTGEAVKNQNLWLKMDKLMNSVDVEWVHVKGHSGIYGNERADRLAVLGASAPR